MALYRLLLRLYPASFRNEYGLEMQRLFAERRKCAGLTGRLALWLEALGDAIVTAPGVHWDLLEQDVRYAARTLSRAPGFTATAIGVTALGIGAIIAVFSITDRVLLRPLPFKHSERLVQIWERVPGYPQMEPSFLNYRDWKTMATSFEAMGAHTPVSVNLLANEPEQVAGLSVTADVFPLLDVQPALGRWFLPAEDQPGAPGTVVISDRLWRTTFAADPNVIGKSVRLDPDVYVIVGVMPPSFYYPDRNTELWVPMRYADSPVNGRDNKYLGVVARLKPGLTLTQARSEMETITASLEQSYPKDNEQAGATLRELGDQVSRQSRLLLRVLLGASACVLLIACTNLASLLLTRFITRRREITVRAALGAGRERIVRQLLTETLLLSTVGGIAGIAIAAIATPLLARLVPTSLPVSDATVLDARVMLFAAGLTTLTGLLFGVAPALRVWRGADVSALREGPRAAIGGRRQRLRGGLVIAQVTASILLLVSAGLMMRALIKVQSIDPGFRAENVLTMRTPLPAGKYPTTAARIQFYERVIDQVSSLPGVESAAYTSGAPMVMRGGIWPVEMPGLTAATGDNDVHSAGLRLVSPGLFQTLRIPLRAGRDVARSDTFDSRFVAVVSSSFASRYFPKGDAIGRSFKFAFFDRAIVGVVEDVRVRGLERISEPQVYVPYAQVPDGGVPFYAPKDLLIKTTTSDAMALAPAVRRIIRGADPALPISNVRTMADIVALETSARQTQISVLGLFAGVSLLLAAVGIHGLLSFTVSQRRQEIGVRMALGARRGQVLRMILRESAVLATAGGLIGMALAYAGGRAFEALLAGVEPGDVPTFAAAAAVAVVMTLSGSIVPALRAVRVEPTVALRAP
ncbi:MAG: ABC transporter permease [Vicinamibacterales bacterium]